MAKPMVVDALALNWVGSTDIRFKQVREFTNVSERPATANRGNVDCNFQYLVTRPASISNNLIARSEVGTNVCTVETNFGVVGGGLLQRSGTGVAGPFTGRSNKEFLAMGSRLDTGVLLDASAPTGVYLAIAPGLSGNIKTTVNIDKTISHTIKNQAAVVNLYNSLGQQMAAMPDTMAFSSSGKWAVFDSSNWGHVRVNTETGAMLSFGQKSVYNQGFDPSPKMAISSDGRYVVTTKVGTFVVYDLEACLPQTGSLSYLMNCKSRQFEDMRKSKTNFGFAVFYARFANENVINYYTDQLVGGVGVTRQYHMIVGDQPLYGMQYLGLGDSFSSGEGAFDYRVATDTAENKCHLSPVSYPYLVGKSLGKERYESVACSGALSSDVTSSNTKEYPGQMKDGIKQGDRNLTPIFEQFLPGKITQNTFLQELNPEAITISIGGNDLAFADKITECVTGAFTNQTCFDSREDRQEVMNEIYNLVPNLVNTYRTLKDQNRRVYVMGYPKIIKPGGDCANNVQLSAREAAFADKLTVLINDAVEFAAAQAGVVYVDVENLLEGKRLCETSSGDVLVNGITAGKDLGALKIKVLGQESFHPKSAAHELYTAAVLAQTTNLTKPMPVPATPSSYPKLAATDAFFTEVASEGREIYTPKYDDFIAGSRINLGSQQNIVLDPFKTGFGPGALIKAEIHSTPISLGTFTTDGAGKLTATFSIPANIQPGFHSIHFYGTNLAGQNVDIYDYVWVASSDTDFDGDSVLDTAEGCVFNPPSGMDSDKDGIDNACDGVVNPLPPEPTPAPDPTPTPTPQPDPVPTPDPEPTIEPEPIPSPTPLPTPTPDPQPQPDPTPIIIPTPVILPVDPPKPPANNPETAAGNEQTVQTLNPQPASQNITASSTPSTVAVVQNSAPGNYVAIYEEPKIIEQPIVLGESRVEVKTNSELPVTNNTQVVNTKQPKRSWVGYWPYFLVLVGLVIPYLFYRSRSSSN